MMQSINKDLTLLKIISLNNLDIDTTFLNTVYQNYRLSDVILMPRPIIFSAEKYILDH